MASWTTNLVLFYDIVVSGILTFVVLCNEFEETTLEKLIVRRFNYLSHGLIILSIVLEVTSWKFRWNKIGAVGRVLFLHLASDVTSLILVCSHQSFTSFQHWKRHSETPFPKQSSGRAKWATIPCVARHRVLLEWFPLIKTFRYDHCFNFQWQ